MTLLGLIHSILLGQIYEYYFNRQGALYQEISALSHRLPRRSVCTRPALGSVSSVAVSLPRPDSPCRYDPIADKQADLRAILPGALHWLT